ncbi:pseudouridine synthase [Microbulbifer taiwanensis]
MRPYRPPTKPYLAVVYADESLLVLDKPCGLLSVPGRDPAHRDSLASRAQAEYPGALIVHRLDMDTSGLVVMARDPEAHRKLSALFQNRLVEKKYLAKVWGSRKRRRGNRPAADLRLAQPPAAEGGL